MKNTIKGLDYSILKTLHRVNNNYSTVEQCSNFYGVTKNRVEKIIARYRNELESYGLQTLSRKEIREIFNNNVNYIKNVGRCSDIIKSTDRDYVVTNKGLTLLTDDAVLKIGLMIDDYTIVKEQIGCINGRYGRVRKEQELLDILKDILKIYNIDIIKQYSILNYKIDGYIPQLNIAIEYDENNHNYYTYENEELRQRSIENKLKCSFIRISEDMSIGESISAILSEINNKFKIAS